MKTLLEYGSNLTVAVIQIHTDNFHGQQYDQTLMIFLTVSLDWVTGMCCYFTVLYFWVRSVPKINEKLITTLILSFSAKANGNN